MQGAVGTLGIVLAGSLCAGCSAQIGEAQGSPAADAAAAAPDTGSVGVDAAPPADAEPMVQPCVEGDQRVSGDDGSCYMLFYAAVDRATAQASCEALGGGLAAIESADEQAIVAELAALHAVDLPDAWLAGSDALTEGNWIWPDGSLFHQAGAGVLYHNFRSGEPNDNGPNCTPVGEDCLVIEGDVGGTWDDRCCGRSFSYICER